MKTNIILTAISLAFAATSALAQTNVVYGTNAGASLTTGVENTFIGNNSGRTATTASHNTATGDSSMYSTTTGTFNCAFGDDALFSNTTGSYNYAFGYQALKANTGGVSNCAFGYASLRPNTGSNNSGFGHGTLSLNTSGAYNTALGAYAMASNVTGNYNTAIGYLALNKNTATGNAGLSFEALQNNTSGANNTGAGFQALYSNTTGSNNVALGYTAGFTNTTGTGNTIVGYNSDVAAGTYTNCGAFGNGAIAPGNDIIYMGNSTNLLYCALGVWTGSDARFKSNVKENVKGIEFISKLRPVTYNFSTEKLEDHMLQNMPDSLKRMHKAALAFDASSKVVRSGFIAQEVEKASEESGYPNSIVHKPTSSTDYYGVSYQEIVVPLVKAVQEQQSMIDSLKKQVAQLSQIVKATGSNSSSPAGAGNTQSVQLGGDVAMLGQNVPNPFGDQTIINYNVPQNAGSAQIVFADQNGAVIKTVDIRSKGKGQLSVLANELGSGLYTYSLMIDGRTVDTKKMMKQQ